MLLPVFDKQTHENNEIDLFLLYGGDRNFITLVREELGPEEYLRILPIEKKIDAHRRAASIAKIDMDAHQLLSFVPTDLVERYNNQRDGVLHALLDKVNTAHSRAIEHYINEMLPLIQAYERIEKNGIRINEKFVDKKNAEDNLSASERRFFRSTKDRIKDGYVYSRFNLAQQKTGRIKIRSGFNCHGIPHGDPRKSIVSRFKDGLICVYDFNAIDYRSIVASIPDDDFRELYIGHDDFHSRTTLFLFDSVNDLRRKIVKDISYIYIYGGSHATISKKTGLSEGKVDSVISKLDKVLYPIVKFRNDLYARAMKNGYVSLPLSERKVIIPQDAHPGKVLGLYAQSYSSDVFNISFIAIEKLFHEENLKSKIMFTVHDELVIDVHPNEVELIEDFKLLMETAHNTFEGDHVVNVKKGINYDGATD